MVGETVYYIKLKSYPLILFEMSDGTLMFIHLSIANPLQNRIIQLKL